MTSLFVWMLLGIVCPQASAPPALTPSTANASAALAATAQANATLAQQELVQVARNVAPSVVTVRAYVRNGSLPVPATDSNAAGWGGSQPNQDYFGYQLMSAGSGFVVDPAGEVLTCAHSLLRKDGSPPDLVDIELHDRSRVLCDIVGTEPTVNLAILHGTVFPTEQQGKLSALQFGDSDAMEPGMWTIGVGDPAGPEKFFCTGSFIARPSRDCYQDYLSAFFLQTAMVVPPQAYGGPLLNLKGEVIGILAPRDPTPGSDGSAPRFGIELAMPSKIVAGLYASIRTTQSFQSPWLGFSVMSRAELAATRGVDAFNTMSKPQTGILIENVFTPSPASEAGILAGDFLVFFDAFKVFTPVDFQRYMYLAGVDKKVKLEIFRAGRTMHKELTIQSRPAQARPR